MRPNLVLSTLHGGEVVKGVEDDVEEEEDVVDCTMDPGWTASRTHVSLSVGTKLYPHVK